jgi:hypothetical protein
MPSPRAIGYWCPGVAHILLIYQSILIHYSYHNMSVSHMITSIVFHVDLLWIVCWWLNRNKLKWKHY